MPECSVLKLIQDSLHFFIFIISSLECALWFSVALKKTNHTKQLFWQWRTQQ